MINPTEEDVVITSFNDFCVFVRYGSDKGSKGTSRTDLEWSRFKRTNSPLVGSNSQLRLEDQK